MLLAGLHLLVASKDITCLTLDANREFLQDLQRDCNDNVTIFAYFTTKDKSFERSSRAF